MYSFNEFDISPEAVCRRRKHFLIFGVIMVLIGAAAFAAPLAAGYAIEVILAAALLIAGFTRVGLVWSEKSWTQLFLAFLTVFSGVFLLIRPMAGMITLGAMMGSFFLLSGIAKCVEWWRMRALGASVMVLVSGMLDAVFALIIWSDFFTAASAPGLILGVNLMFSGVALISLSRSCR